mmetsp:Transcript_104343/g.301848  ORF Transcript_104343/g.301848 Transcript_104343/m.301848 type:complete len:117 (+) Transcript_104343:203-553(+)
MWLLSTAASKHGAKQRQQQEQQSLRFEARAACAEDPGLAVHQKTIRRRYSEGSSLQPIPPAQDSLCESSFRCPRIPAHRGIDRRHLARVACSLRSAMAPMSRPLLLSQAAHEAPVS